MDQSQLLRLSLSLVLVVVLILAAAWLARRSGLLRNRGQASIHVLGSQSLGGRNSIVVVEIEQQRLVLGVTQHQISLLHTLSDPDHSRFDHKLQQAMHQSKKTSPSESTKPIEPTEPSENNPS